MEKEAILFGADNGLGSFLPLVGPAQLYGIEINPYAHDLAQMTVWIGWLQWIRVNGFGFPAEPILRPLSGNIRLMDAILNEDGIEPDWPKVDYIIGNPPFLGGKILRRELGDEYVDRLFALWRSRIRPESDLCCYWFEKARAQIVSGKCKRAGLLATQGIRGGANREVLKRIKESGDIFWAESDRPWILDGANVHVSMIGFDTGEETECILNTKTVPTINSNLASAQGDTKEAKSLPSNLGLCFMGTTKGGGFDICEAQAVTFLLEPNAHNHPNSDILVPWVNGLDVTRRLRDMWIIDFGVGMDELSVSRYERPFRYIFNHVKPVRERNNRESYRRLWWQQVEARPALRSALEPLPRFLATIAVAKNRLFVWMEAPSQPDHALFVFARSDDYFFGVLHSRFHEVWALKLGTRLETRPRYTPTTCFETSPFPEPHAEHDAAIAQAATELNKLRETWLNPPEWTTTEVLKFPGTVGGPRDRYIAANQVFSGNRVRSKMVPAVIDTSDPHSRQ